jgi:hypothetical protein
MGASAAAAAGGQSEHVFESGSPSTAVNLLERYLNGHQGLKQKAGELGNSSLHSATQHVKARLG